MAFWIGFRLIGPLNVPDRGYGAAAIYYVVDESDDYVVDELGARVIQG